MVELLQKKAAEGKGILINREKGATDRMKLQGALRQGWGPRLGVGCLALENSHPQKGGLFHSCGWWKTTFVFKDW